MSTETLGPEPRPHPVDALMGHGRADRSRIGAWSALRTLLAAAREATPEIRTMMHRKLVSFYKLKEICDALDLALMHCGDHFTAAELFGEDASGRRPMPENPK
jgi:hypothetical protein